MFKQIVKLRMSADNDELFPVYVNNIDHNRIEYVLMKNPDIESYRDNYKFYSEEIANLETSEQIMEAHEDMFISRFKMSTYPTEESFINDDIKGILNPTFEIQIKDVYTNKKYRNLGYTSKFIRRVIYDRSRNYPYTFAESCVYLKAVASTKEYPVEPTEEEYAKIIEGVTTFFEKIGFVDINYISDFDYGRTMIYVSSNYMRNLLKYSSDTIQTLRNRLTQNLKG